MSLSTEEFKRDLLNKRGSSISVVNSSSWFSGRKIRLHKDRERYIQEQEAKDEKKKEEEKIRKRKEIEYLKQLSYRLMNKVPPKLPLTKAYPQLKPRSSYVDLGGKLNTMKCKDCDMLIVPFCKYSHSCIPNWTRM